MNKKIIALSIALATVVTAVAVPGIASARMMHHHHRVVHHHHHHHVVRHHR